MEIQITSQERAQNAAFQIKQLLLSVSQLKQQINAAIAIISGAAEGVSADEVKSALGDASADMLAQLEALNAAIK